MKTHSLLRSGKTLTVIIFALLYLQLNAGSTYVLNLSDPNTYSITCGTVNSTLWTVSNSNCTLTTSILQLDNSALPQNLSVAITIEGAAMDNSDIANIDYMINEDWIRSAEIHGQPGLHTYTHNFIITANGGSLIALRINLINNNNAESWRIFNGNIIVGSESPLPVDLISFSAEKAETGIYLEWATASETNCSYFTLEKSPDGKSFSCLAKITGSGNASVIKRYSMTDPDAFDGMNYYRLTQTDFNGSVHQTGNIVAVNYHKNNSFLNVFPNPNNGSGFFIQLNNSQDAETIITITDETGRQLYFETAATDNLSETIKIDASEKKVEPGLYLITALNNGMQYQQKVLIR